MQGTECDLRLRSVFCHCVPELFSCDTSSSHFTSTTILGHIYRRDKTDRRDRKERSGRRHKCGRDKLGTWEARETGLKVTCERRFLQILLWFSHFLNTHYPWWTMDIALTSAAPVRLERQRFPSTRFTCNRRLSSDKGRLWHYGGTWVQQKLNKIPPSPF